VWPHQFELSKKIRRTEESISNIEQGISTAKIDILVDLAKTLEVEIDDLFQENIVLIRNILGIIKQNDILFLNMILSYLQNLEKFCKK
jgi:DNA-binding XRE family transcriptional regulator